MDFCLPSAWNGSWDDAQNDPSAASAVSAIVRAIVFVSTLIIQDILADPDWADTLSETGRHGLTPQFWAHLLPYGEGRLDMASRPQLSGV